MTQLDFEPLEAHGEFPPVLYRAFSKEQHARDFIERGRIRLGLVDYYKNLEDPSRGDTGEGEAKLLIPGDVVTVMLTTDGQYVGQRSEPGFVQYSGTFVNPVYVLCFSCPPDARIDLVPAKFGRYVVRIDDPRRLAQEITDALTIEGELRGTPVVECIRVRFNQGEKAADVIDHGERTRLAFSQKRRSFADEYEFRFAVVASPRYGVANERIESPLHHDVDLAGPVDYAKLIIR